MSRFNEKKHKGVDFKLKDGRTKQADSVGCDINVLMARYEKTGDARILNIGNAIPQYGDFSNAPDFMQAQLQMKEADKLFMELPWQIRARFENEPGNLMEFMSELNAEEVDQAVVDEALELGLVERPQGWTPKKPEEAKEPVKPGVTDVEDTKLENEGE